ncbi:hypothetical protein [Arsenicibacter rosenii]|uniref:Carboxypeptidase regulatory-like domain-containing protein n=1 Tax=Arsenicibacter rosenii TaxID=1750698 RepID=A0A1S2VCG8_9BACT|nr:hypothetical protein [Arsenicibacter rosenii]OIN56431.1 hypothetical protein BLX24_24990 [Arsenicibacter rosenii]
MKNFFINNVGIFIVLIFLHTNKIPFQFSKNNNCIATKNIIKNNKNNTIISGIILDCKTQKPLKVAIIKINKTTFYSDTLGRFRHQVKPGNYTIKAGWPTYLWQQINTTVKNKDSLFVTFYLEDDPAPLK